MEKSTKSTSLVRYPGVVIEPNGLDKEFWDGNSDKWFRHRSG